MRSFALLCFIIVIAVCGIRATAGSAVPHLAPRPVALSQVLNKGDIESNIDSSEHQTKPRSDPEVENDTGKGSFV